MRIVRNATGFLFGLAAVGLIALCAHSAAPMDLPREQPVSATGFFCASGERPLVLIVAVVVSYPSGKVVRFDAQHMHGLESTDDLMKYASSATDQKTYSVDCANRSAT